MEVSQPRFELRKAADALTNARSLIHTFQVKPVAKAVADGEAVVADVQAKADHALAEHTSRQDLAGDLPGAHLAGDRPARLLHSHPAGAAAGVALTRQRQTIIVRARVRADRMTLATR